MTTFKVTNNNDDGQGSLRQAIFAARINPGADTIDLTSVSGVINLQTTLMLNLSNSNDLTLKDDGNTTLDGGGKVQIMTIKGGGQTTIGSSGKAIIDGVSFAHGLAKGGDGIGNGGGGLGAGGAIYMTGYADVTIKNGSFSDNRAEGGTGGSPLGESGGWGGSVGDNGQPGGMGGALNSSGIQTSGGAGGAVSPAQAVGPGVQNAKPGELGQNSTWFGVGGGGGGGGGAVASGQNSNPAPGVGGKGGAGGFGAGGGGTGGGGAYENSSTTVSIPEGGVAGLFGGKGGAGSLPQLIDAGSPGSGGGGAGLGGAIFQENGWLKLDNLRFSNNSVERGEAGSANPANEGFPGSAYGKDIFSAYIPSGSGAAPTNIGSRPIALDLSQSQPNAAVTLVPFLSPISANQLAQSNSSIPAPSSSFIQVENNNDAGAGSLRDAIQQAALKPGYDIIDLTRVSGAIKLKSSLILDAGNSLLILDDGNSSLDGQNQYQIMTIKGADVTINRLSFSNGLARGGDGGIGGGGGGLGAGGALFIESGDVNLYGTVFNNNKAQGGKGGASSPKDVSVTPNATVITEADPGGNGGAFNESSGLGNPQSKGGDKGEHPITNSPEQSPERGYPALYRGYDGGYGESGIFGQGGGGGGGGASGNQEYPGYGGPGGNGGFGAGGGGGGGGGSYSTNEYRNNQGVPGEGGGRYSNDGGKTILNLGGRGSFGEEHNEKKAGLSGAGGGGAGLGGAIFVKAGSLQLFDSVFSLNTAKGGSAGDTHFFAAQRGKGLGSDIFNYQGTVSNAGSADLTVNFSDYLGGGTLDSLTATQSNSSGVAYVNDYSKKISSTTSIKAAVTSDDLRTRDTLDGKHHYLYSLSTEGSWAQADVEARMLGGNLVTFNLSADEYNAKIKDLTAWYGSKQPWIGLSDIAQEGKLAGSDTLSPVSVPLDRNSDLTSLNTNFRDYAYLTTEGSLTLASAPQQKGLIASNVVILNTGRSSYQLTSGPMTFDEAEREAISKGGHLVKIDSGQENQIVDSFIEKLISSKTQQFNALEYVWIGAKRTASQWKWLMDGTDISGSSTFWRPSGQDGSSNGPRDTAVFAVNWNQWVSNPKPKDNQPEIPAKIYGVIEIPVQEVVPQTITTAELVPQTITTNAVWGGHRYVLSNALNWWDAEREAQLYGGHVVTVDSKAEQDWLFRTFNPTSQTPLWITNMDQSGNKMGMLSGRVHYYQLSTPVTANTGGLTWTQAETQAQRYGGHLVKIDSQQEQDWLFNTFKPQTQPGNGLWIGATDQTREGTFRWPDGTILRDNGRDTLYSNWNSGDPNNYGGSENHVTMTATGKWVDLDQSNSANVRPGIIETNGKFVGDASINTTWWGEPVTFTGGWIGSKEGHYYILSNAGGRNDAEAEAQSYGGHLVTINSKAEQDWLLATFKPTAEAPLWIGATDQAKEGTFTWPDGTTLRNNGKDILYSNWNDGEPNNTWYDGSPENAVIMLDNGKWNDIPDNNLNNPPSSPYKTSGLRGIIEIEKLPTLESPAILELPGPDAVWGGNRYVLSNALNWWDAEREAQRYGGHVVTVDSKAEQDWLFKTFNPTSQIPLWITNMDQSGNKMGMLSGRVHYYQLSTPAVASTGGLTWTQAETQAQQYGGHLVKIDSQQEQDWLFNTFKPQTQPGNGLWIGATDQTREGTFRWPDGTILRDNGRDTLYSNWNSGDPNNYGGSENHVTMTATGKWVDLDQSNSANVRPGIIETNGKFVGDTSINTTWWGEPVTFTGGWIGSDEGHYYILSNAGGRNDAEAEAQSYGGHLVSINSKAEQDWLLATFKPTAEAPLWIGVTNQAKEGTFINDPSLSPYKTSGLRGIIEIEKQPATLQAPAILEIPVADSSISISRAGIIEREYFQWTEGDNPSGNIYLLSGRTGRGVAEAQAKQLGGHLVTINSREESDWLLKTFGTAPKLWIGAAETGIQATAPWTVNDGDGPLQGIMEIPANKPQDAKDTGEQSFYVLEKPVGLDIERKGGDASELFQLSSYVDDTPEKTLGGHSQKVWGGDGSDVFNVGFQQTDSRIGIDFDSGKLKKLAISLIEPDWDVMAQRRAMEETAADASKNWELETGLAQVAADTAIGLVKDALDASSSAIPVAGSLIKGFSQTGLTVTQGVVDAGFVIANAFHNYETTMDQIAANYDFDIQEYQNGLRGIDEFFEGQDKTGSWGSVDINQKRSVVKIMDFQPGIDTIILPKPDSALGMYSAKTYQSDNTGTLVAISYSNQGSSQEAAKDFLFLQIANTSIPGLSDTALDKFIESLFMYGDDNVTISTQTYHTDSTSTKGLIGVTDIEKSGTPADDFIYSLEANKNEKVTLRGEAGNDVLRGRPLDSNYEPQLSILDGGDGNDLMYAGSINDTIDGGDGYDQVDFSGYYTGVNTSSSDFNGKNFKNIESFVGGEFGDQLSLANTAISQQPAIAGQDYQIIRPTKLSFAPGERIKTVMVDILGQDKIWETPETFGLLLENPQGATLVNNQIDNLGIATVLDGDTSGLPTLAIDGSTVMEGDYVVFTPKLNIANANPVSFKPVIYGATATIGNDVLDTKNLEIFNAKQNKWTPLTDNTVTIPANSADASVQLRIKTLNDTDNEGAEWFSLIAKNITGARTGTDLSVVDADGIIIDDEGSSSFFISDEITSENKNMSNGGGQTSGKVTFTIARSGSDISQAASVWYHTIEDTPTILHLDGKGGNDTLTGTAYQDVIEGGAGNDDIQLIQDNTRDVVVWKAPVLKDGKVSSDGTSVKFGNDYVIKSDNSLYKNNTVILKDAMIPGETIQTSSDVFVRDYAFKYGSVPNDGFDTVQGFERNAGKGDLLRFEGIPDIDVVVSGRDTRFKVSDGIEKNPGFDSGDTLVTLVGVTGFSPDDALPNKASLAGATFHFA